LTPEEIGSRLAALRSILDGAGCAHEILAHDVTRARVFDFTEPKE
jgi:hypothetical protein